MPLIIPMAPPEAAGAAAAVCAKAGVENIAVLEQRWRNNGSNAAPTLAMAGAQSKAGRLTYRPGRRNRDRCAGPRGESVSLRRPHGAASRDSSPLRPCDFLFECSNTANPPRSHRSESANCVHQCAFRSVSHQEKGRDRRASPYCQIGP